MSEASSHGVKQQEKEAEYQKLYNKGYQDALAGKFPSAGSGPYRDGFEAAQKKKV